MFYTDRSTNRMRAVSYSLPLLFQLLWFVLGWRFFEEFNSETLYIEFHLKDKELKKIVVSCARLP